MQPDSTVELSVDGTPVALRARTGTSLLRALHDAGHTGPKNGCEEGECGACTVVLDGVLACSCLVPALTCASLDVHTVVSAVTPEITEAFARHGAVQCGFCTPGFVVTTAHLLARTQHTAEPLDEAMVLEALSGNLCRCTGYRRIVAAVLELDRGRRAGVTA